MKNIRLMGIVGVFCVLIAGCAGSLTKDITVSSEADPKANLGGYKSYAWLGSARLLYDPQGRWVPRAVDLDAEIRHLIDRELRNRGVMPASANPDMLVAYVAGADMSALKLEKDPKSDIELIRNVPQGSLLVLLIDAETGLAIWAGLAHADIHEDPPADVVRKRLDYAVSRMFKKMPS